jgi:glutamate-1-semialdehyde 2,1-aminomutase
MRNRMTGNGTRDFARSIAYMDRARMVIPRGTTSARRADRLPTPLVFQSAKGSRLLDVDGNEYIDYVAGMGPMLLGHQHPVVVETVARELGAGVLYGGQHAGELDLAERLVRLIPSAEGALLCSTGSEAAAAATKLVRAATGRSTIVKFEGHYHGWLEPLAVSLPGTDPGPHGRWSPLGEPGQPTPNHVLVAPWNDLPTLEGLLTESNDHVAAVVMEPIACNAGNLHPNSGYLAGVRDLCRRLGILLIFDEIITGFRLGLGGAQEITGVIPDVTLLGKAIGSGYPLAAVVGRGPVMQVAASTLSHVGTYNGNVASMAAGNATLGVLEDGASTLYPHLDRLADRLARGLLAGATRCSLPLEVLRAGSILRLVWGGPRPVRTYADIRAADASALAAFAMHLQLRGVHALGRGLWYVSTAHTETDIDRTLEAADAAFEALADELSATGRA